jgi:manganese-dependent ADP-ribose/CDP-alcohol diphosphatase
MYRIGLIADVQYADIDDVWNFMKTHKRKYRATLACLRNAVDWWLSQPSLDLVIDLGDSIDGFRNPDRASGMHAIRRVMAEWNRLETERPSLAIPHLIGNHELYKFTRSELTCGVENTGFMCSAPKNLCVIAEPSESFYYSFKLPSSSIWRVIVLDPYYESVMRNGGGRVGIELTVENGGLDANFTKLCQANNPNDILKASNYFSGVVGEQSRWCPFNGGLGSIQREWLENLLSMSEQAGERVLIASHVIIHPKATPSGNCHTILWDYDEVLEILGRFECVKLVFCGHAHHEGYHHCPETGIHHISLPSPLEAPDDVLEQTYGLLELSDHGAIASLVGQGWVTSRTMALR